MATNFIQEGRKLRLTVGSTVVSGDPVAIGNAIRGVAITDYSAADAKATIDTEGVYDLSVQAVDDDGNSAVAAGDRLYYAGSAAPYLSKKKSGKFFGIALEAVGSGLTATINVLLGGPGGPDRASHMVFAAGNYEVPASPSPDTTTLIPVTGIAATDIVFVTPTVNAGSPVMNIITAVAQASPAGILVTTDVAPQAADAFDYAVLRAGL